MSHAVKSAVKKSYGMKCLICKIQVCPEYKILTATASIVGFHFFDKRFPFVGSRYNVRIVLTTSVDIRLLYFVRSYIKRRIRIAGAIIINKRLVCEYIRESVVKLPQTVFGIW